MLSDTELGFCSRMELVLVAFMSIKRDSCVILFPQQQKVSKRGEIGREREGSNIQIYRNNTPNSSVKNPSLYVRYKFDFLERSLLYLELSILFDIYLFY